MKKVSCENNEKCENNSCEIKQYVKENVKMTKLRENHVERNTWEMCQR